MNSTAMEQRAKHTYGGMWGARRSGSTSNTIPTIPWAAAYSSEPSWEEQAFARDAAANLGGCVWPPRSYSCSFCQREFRSAQALGGHMNVHRRDRARLRQCSSPEDVQEAPHDHQPHQDTFSYRAISNPSTSTPTVPLPAKGDVTSTSTTAFPSYLSTIIKESKNKALMSMPMSMAVRGEAIYQYDYDHDDEEESGRTTKRRRVYQPSVARPIFVRPAAAASPLVASCQGEEGLQGAVDHDAKVHKTTASPSSTSPLVDRQEVDLELRLGTTPKVT